MKVLKGRPESLTDAPWHYCPGCGHGVAHRLLAEAIDEFGVREKTVGIAPVGCAVFAYNYFNVDMIEAPHGRAPAVATGVKRVLPDSFVFSYQGDGDLAAIGTAETVHAANRGENITLIFINNAIYGMTGGQMAPTTMLNQKTTTTPYGRDSKTHGFPIRVCELLSTLDGVVFAERVSVSSPANVLKAKQAINRACETQINKEGFSIVEILSQCPTNWKMKPLDAIKWVDEEMTKVFPLGNFKDVRRGK